MDQLKDISDRSDVFYWQTDRAVDPKKAGEIWADRHHYFTDEELLERSNEVLTADNLSKIEPLSKESQTNLGNVNSVRSGILESGKKIIIRAHPKGIKNGYFYVESLVAKKAKEMGLPSYSTLAIHEYSGENDFAFQIIEKLPGIAIQKWLEAHPEDEISILFKVGEMMARIHQIKVKGFGPFDNEKAKNNELIGIYNTLGDSVRAGLNFNLKVLHDFGIFNDQQIQSITKLFSEEQPLLKSDTAVLVHNDFADWNLLTDGKEVTGILDWDECVASDPISDIACWSTFFDVNRLEHFLKGYFSIVEKSVGFDEKFQLMRLRYTISKMTLRLRRYSWEPTESMKNKIEIGKQHLAKSLEYFKL